MLKRDLWDIEGKSSFFLFFFVPLKIYFSYPRATCISGTYTSEHGVYKELLSMALIFPLLCAYWKYVQYIQGFRTYFLKVYIVKSDP